MKKCRSFKPIVNDSSAILILGSMPGVKSLEAQQYYAHPQNRFWKIIGMICNNSNMHLLEYEKKVQIISDNHFALWDVICSCERQGSLDSNIEKEVPNKIKALLKKYPNIKKICLNGNKSYMSFKKYFPELLEEYVCYKLPSTSPANAKFSLENLYLEWSQIIEN